MSRRPTYRSPRRINIIIEADLHDAAIAKSKDLSFRGGFSEYVGRLIAADRKRKGRDLIKAEHTSMPRAA